MKNFFIFLLLSSQVFLLQLNAAMITGQGKHARRFLFIPVGSKNFSMAMNEEDSIGSVIQCMDQIHKRGGGVCQIEAHSLKPGKHMTLPHKYNNVFISVLPETSAQK